MKIFESKGGRQKGSKREKGRGKRRDRKRKEEENIIKKRVG